VLFAQCHSAGVLQADMHAGNVLVQAKSGADIDESALRLYLVDLPTAKLSRCAGWRATRQNLAIFCAAMTARTTRSERWRFWRRYLAARSDLAVPDRRQAAMEILRRAGAWARCITRRRDRRCFASNRDFLRLRHSAGVAHVVHEVAPETTASLLRHPESLLHGFRHQVEKLSHSSVVVKAELPLQSGIVDVAYKRSRVKSWWKRLLARFRGDRALAAWRLGHALLSRGIATARPIGVWRPGRTGESYLATEWIPGAENLHLYGWRLASLAARERGKRAIECLESVGHLIGRLHAWRIAHRDLKAVNLLVARDTAGLRAYLIDLDGLEFRRWLPPRTRWKNLARLAVSLRLHPWITRTQCLRWLKAYHRELQEDRDWKTTWRQVAARCAKAARRMERRGRVVA
jgi:tRNA A-37 threonylcarbamoyl transferase component Bud32